MLFTRGTNWLLKRQELSAPLPDLQGGERCWGMNLSCMCVCVCVLVAQSCLTLCGLMDCNLPGSSVHGIFQARILEWVAILFSRRSSRPGIKPENPALAGGFFTTKPPEKPLMWLLLLLSCFSCVRLFTTPQTAAYQAPPSMGFSRQEYWSGVPLPSLPNVEILAK